MQQLNLLGYRRPITHFLAMTNERYVQPAAPRSRTQIELPPGKNSASATPTTPKMMTPSRASLKARSLLSAGLYPTSEAALDAVPTPAIL